MTEIAQPNWRNGEHFECSWICNRCRRQQNKKKLRKNYCVLWHGCSDLIIGNCHEKYLRVCEMWVFVCDCYISWLKVVAIAWVVRWVFVLILFEWNEWMSHFDNCFLFSSLFWFDLQLKGVFCEFSVFVQQRKNRKVFFSSKKQIKKDCGFSWEDMSVWMFGVREGGESFCVSARSNQ